MTTEDCPNCGASDSYKPEHLSCGCKLKRCRACGHTIYAESHYTKAGDST